MSVASWRNERRGTFFKLVDNFFSGFGEIVVASRLGEMSELVNLTPRDASDAGKKNTI